ncbi:MAG: FecR domain-containing protein [Planctomycetes bacterium]|nr:FecR domain-containing protein [Planctomycetota bacterium]
MMNKSETLIEKLLDGSISEEEERELCSLIDNGEVEKKTVLDLLELDSALRGMEVRINKSESIMSQIRHAEAKKTQEKVLESIKGSAATPKRINLRKATGARHSRNHDSGIFIRLSVAASILIIFGVAIYNSLFVSEAPANWIATLEASSGKVSIRRDDKLIPLGLNDQPLKLINGDKITTAPASTAKIKYKGEETAITLATGSDLKLFTDPVTGGKRLHLDSGMIECSVTKQPAGSPFILETAESIATVVGTEFTLQAMPGKSILAVKEGAVRFSLYGRKEFRLVKGGEQASSSDLTMEYAAADAPIIIEAEKFGNGAKAELATRESAGLCLESPEADGGANGGFCVTAPRIGVELSGTVDLPKGRWNLWVRYRDDMNGSQAFEVLVDGKRIANHKSKGEMDSWEWARFTFESSGEHTRLALRSLSDSKLAPEGLSKPNIPFRMANRWDTIILTRNAQYKPEER